MQRLTKDTQAKPSKALKTKTLKQPTHASSTRKATNEKTLVGQQDDDTCLSNF
jgi:hypothetical protein